VPSPQGFNHIALFYPLNSSTPIFLTNGSWEVAGNVESVDKEGRVWFLSAGSGSAEGGGGETFGTGRHLQYVTIPSLEEVKKLESGKEDDRRKGMKITQMAPSLVNASSPIAPAVLRNTLSPALASSVSAQKAREPSMEDLSLVSVLSPSGRTTGTVEVAGKEVKGNVSYYGVDFSPEGGFYLLSYEGPGVPWQRIVRVGDECECCPSLLEFLVVDFEIAVFVLSSFEGMKMMIRRRVALNFFLLLRFAHFICSVSVVVWVLIGFHI
jgi:hypothetical protein